MGIYDTFVDGNVAVQIKYTNDEDSMPIYNVGELIATEDCVLIGYEGVVVIKDGIVVMVTENLMDKWGHILDCHEIVGAKNPIQIAVDNLVDKYITDKDLTTFTDIDGDDFLDELVDV